MTLALDLAYVAPTTLDDALLVLDEGDGRTALLAGGTDLVPWMRDAQVLPDRVVDLKRIPGLRELALSGGTLRLGCLVTFTDVLTSSLVRDRLPILVEMAGHVASVGIRNRATVVGNLCSALPSGDAGPVLLVLGADVQLVGRCGRRTVPIDAWFAGPRRTALAPGEIVTGVTIPVPDPGHGAAFARLSRYRGEDLAQASVAVLVVPGQATRVAFAAVAPTPLRARRVERILAADGFDPTGGFAPEVVERAVRSVGDDIAPITDLRAGDRYRLRMCEVMLRRALAAATARAAGGGPAYGTSLM
jgi:CO/xanthine dehydrogenase FAD-binding subunit